MRYAIVCQDDQSGPVVILTDRDDTGPLRDEIEAMGWDTIGTARVLTMAQARREMREARP